MSLPPFFRSFSFSIGIIIFVLLGITLLSLRVIINSEYIDAAYDAVNLVIEAHAEEIDAAMDRYGPVYVRELVKNISEDTNHNKLYLLFKTRNTLTGNLQKWPASLALKEGYSEVVVQLLDAAPSIHLLVKTVIYPHDIVLLVGYNLERVDALHNSFLLVIAENIILALLVSLAISTLIIWLLSRHFRRFNIACNQVMAGNLDYRVATKQSGDEFDMLAANINRMLDWNKTLITTVKDSSNAIAHDMRTPLSRLRLELRALSERPKLDNDTKLQVAEHIERVDGLIEMFENILNIARADARSSTELFELLDFQQLVQDVLDFYEPIIEEKQLTLNFTATNTPLFLKGDKQLLGQALVNLIDNACKYTPAHGAITVTLEKRADFVVLTVADTGAGVPPELLEKVKERFFRADASRHTSGHGLGLSLVNAVATLHQGSLTLEDANHGLRVILTVRTLN